MSKQLKLWLTLTLILNTPPQDLEEDFGLALAYFNFP